MDGQWEMDIKPSGLVLIRPEPLNKTYSVHVSAVYASCDSFVSAKPDLDDQSILLCAVIRLQGLIPGLKYC